MRTDRRPCAGVREEKVWDKFSDCLGLGIDRGTRWEAGRHVVTILPPRLDVTEGELAWLVKCDPPGDLFPECLSDFFRIPREEIGKFMA